MSTLYLLEQGAKLVKEQKRFVVEKDGNILLEIPEFKIERVLVFGNIQITTQAIKFLLESGIETAFFTIYGKLIGRLQPIESKNVFLRTAQYERHRDQDFKLKIAKILVEGKIKNIRVMLQRFARNHPEVDFSQALSELDSCLIELPNKTQVSTVIGIEGRASAIYFQNFGKMLRPARRSFSVGGKELQFTTRSRRPPLDPVNSLLSLGYSLVTNEIFSVTTAVGFDPYVGFLHGIEYGRPSLALDLVEEFRQAVVDRLTLELVNKEILTEGDFITGGEEKEGGIYLKDESRKTYFLHYEKRMLTSFQDTDTKDLSAKVLTTAEEINFRKMFFKQAQRLAKTISEGVPYQPFLIK